MGIGKRNSWRKAESLSSLGAGYPGYIFGLLKSKQDVILKYSPDLVAADGSIRSPTGGDAGESVMVITRVELVDRLVRCEVVAGTYGEHDDLVGDDVVKIGNRAAGRRYWVDLYLPVAGDYGMAVAETRKSYTPISELLRWLAWLDLSQYLRQKEEVERDLASGTITAADAAEKLETLTWRKLRVNQVSDGAYLRKIISGASKVSVDLVQATATTSRGRFRDVQRKLTVLDVAGGVQEDLATEILSWLDGATEGVVGRVMSKLKLNRDDLAEAGLGFNNTAVRLQGDQTVSVTPASVRDLFTYPLGTGVQPDAMQWEQATRAKLFELAKLEKCELGL